MSVDYWVQLGSSARRNSRVMFNTILNIVNGNKAIDDYISEYGELYLIDYSKKNKKDYEILFSTLKDNDSVSALLKEDVLVDLFLFKDVPAVLHNGIFYLFKDDGLTEKPIIK